MSYRKDIDGLRAIAVLAVLFYHASIRPFLGGYLGVDVFFVISGYLITDLILRERAAGAFSLVNFYDRRARRILPALMLVLTVATATALFVLLPDELIDFARSLLASALFYANFYDWHQQVGYSGVAATANPLLHIWSLAVEEQFYLVWPLFLIGFTGPRLRRFLPHAIVILAALSLGIGIWIGRRAQDEAFFLLHTRAWELLAGAFLATGIVPAPVTRVMRNGLCVAGLVLIGCSVTALVRNTYFPAWNALCATLGAALVIQSARARQSMASRILGSPVPVFVGKISYSLYLWHWPMLVFAKLYLDRDLALGERLALLAASFVLACGSWWFVERPARRSAFFVRKIPVSFIAGSAAALALSCAAAASISSNGLPLRMPPAIRVLYGDLAPPLSGKHCKSHASADMSVWHDCAFADSTARGQMVVWGDSHASALVIGLKDFAAERGLELRLIALGGCPPLPGVSGAHRRQRLDPVCANFDDDAMRLLSTPGAVKLVVLQGDWIATSGDLPDKRTSQPLRQAFASSLDGVVRTLTQRGLPVLIVGSVPHFHVSPWRCLGHEALLGHSGAGCDVAAASYMRRQAQFDDGVIRDVAAHYPNVRAFYPVDVLCGPVVCNALSQGHLIVRDEHHFSAFGALLVGRALDAALRNWAMPSALP
jgi:peptidoglycan/LPS O-acetylase OafA/YrhL